MSRVDVDSTEHSLVDGQLDTLTLLDLKKVHWSALTTGRSLRRIFTQDGRRLPSSLRGAVELQKSKGQRISWMRKICSRCEMIGS